MADSSVALNDSPLHLLDKANTLTVSGGMAFAFKRVLDNVAIGDSLFDEAGAKTVQQPSSCDVPVLTGRGKDKRTARPLWSCHGGMVHAWFFCLQSLATACTYRRSAFVWLRLVHIVSGIGS
ncbi:uncharacterized protein SPSK_10719 [Sporothrix schenckii 1099-18]|uniref:Phosphoglycerate kinase n=1 Tax=Sporothrix schenckii 1099-18 TaxID=1397361 RepID=A0A0F2MJZ0_SPOSC|nr:uncharacterized protein SPSK_10719 [Sporothrix schenckii 1099-18]KJR90013.1 hypothetical protein SPSK_10719 [Sporothrix schenckii 1099-18]